MQILPRQNNGKTSYTVLILVQGYPAAIPTLPHTYQDNHITYRSTASWVG